MSIKWKKLLEETIIPVTIFVVPLCLIIGIMMWLFRGEQNLPELIIPARGCLFRIETNNTPEFFKEVLVNNKLRIIIDDKEYWIRVDDETTNRFYKEVSP